jgi:phosphoribosylanthranilate isomerase
MTWIKICGITNLEDALVAVDAGADALGFVFYDNSPRKVDAETVRGIVKELPPAVEKVGVFVGAAHPDWLNVLFDAGLDAAQHVSTEQGGPGFEKATGASVLPRIPRVYISLPIGELLQDDDQVKSLAANFTKMGRTSPDHPPLLGAMFDTFFLDSGNGHRPGGTGHPFDWRKAVPIADAMRDGGLRLVVAGGLSPANVAEAIEVLHPWGVDVASGVEERPRKKDPQKVRAFVQAVRRTEKSA